ncbi:MAG: class I poly(R)-hydroxyalkanoic acid synthase, partial [Vicinamibacterales bacterium]
AAAEWHELPYFALLQQHYLLSAEYLKEVAMLAPLPDPDKQRLKFLTRQAIDALAPTNFPATNPEVIKRALKTDGASLAQGFANFVADAQKGRISMTDERAFAVGENLAITPGHVVFRNDLIELIQYSPSTKQVHRRALLMVPPCINKYYILDLQPENSFVRWTVAQGHTVFMISWRNIPASLGHLQWDDYIVDGVLHAIDVVKTISGSPAVNALGICVGGTILAGALAVLAARGDRSVTSTTLLTTLLDFDDPGEIGVYVSREMLAARDPMLMAGQRIHGGEIARAFASLRANDLVWNYVVNNYLKGETPPAFDLLYWNGDSANLPGPMYAYYLRSMYLDNQLREPGALTMAGEAIDLSRIGMPAYVLATREDHIVPWRGAYKTIGLLGGDKTFVVGASGHIAGVVNPPEKKRRNFWIDGPSTTDADEWLAGAESRPGSWWTHWAAWLAPRGGAKKAAPRAAGNSDYPALDPAPGRYVRETAD